MPYLLPYLKEIKSKFPKKLSKYPKKLSKFPKKLSNYPNNTMGVLNKVFWPGQRCLGHATHTQTAASVEVPPVLKKKCQLSPIE